VGQNVPFVPDLVSSVFPVESLEAWSDPWEVTRGSKTRRTANEDRGNQEGQGRTTFRPFWIRTADGKEFHIRHPDAVAWHDDEEDDRDDEDNGETRGPLIAVCMVPGGGWAVVELALVTFLGFEPVSSKGKGKSKGKRA
jgi:hypothetical protein